MEQDPRIFAHFTADVVSGIVWLLVQFELRALMLAREQDHVVFLACEEDPANIEAQRVFLRGIGIGPKQEHMHFGFSGVRKGGTIDAFSGTSEELRRLAKQYRMEVNGPSPEQCWQANDKAVFRQVCERDEEMRGWIPPGFVAPPTSFAGSAARLFAEHVRIVAKDSLSASGINQARYARGESLALPAELRQASRLVVEAFVFPDVPAYDQVDLSAQMYVPKASHRSAPDPDAIQPLAVLCQHVSEDGHHYGNWGPATISLTGKRGVPLALSACAMERAMIIAREICRETGYWGPCSVDFKVRISTGELYALDPNFRITAPSYALKPMLNLFGEIRPFDMRSFPLPHGMTFAQVLDHFREELYRPSREAGFVPFCHVSDNGGRDGMDRAGFCYGLALAPTVERLLDVVDAVEAKKTLLRARLAR